MDLNVHFLIRPPDEIGQIEERLRCKNLILEEKQNVNGITYSVVRNGGGNTDGVMIQTQIEFEYHFETYYDNSGRHKCNH